MRLETKTPLEPTPNQPTPVYEDAREPAPENMPARQPRFSGNGWWSLIGLVAVLTVATLLLFYHNNVLDWLTLRNYQPSAEVQQLADQSSMTPYGERLFMVNRPKVENRETFNQHCKGFAEQKAAVLGCFVGDRRGIYLYNVTDQRLDGIKEVTAAHEMLHQAYIRLNSNQRKQVDALLNSFAASNTDQKLKDKLALYQKGEPADLLSEMHSIFATEVESLPAPLETYYAKYFSNRQQVITNFKKYRAAFDERTDQISEYDERLATLRSQIDSGRSELSTKLSSIQAQRAALDALLNSGQTEAYNRGVPAYNSQVASYRQELNSLNSLIAEYNSVVDKRNTIATEEQELIRAQSSQVLSAETH